MLLLLAVLLVMTACGNKTTETSQATTESLTENTEPTAGGNDENDPLSEEMKERILEDFAAFDHGDEYDPSYHGIFQIERYYGSYDGAVAVMLRGSAWDYLEIEYVETVAGITIRCDYGNSVRIWKDGSFYTIQEAYDQGILTAEQVAEIANYRYVKYPTDF